MNYILYPLETGKERGGIVPAVVGEDMDENLLGGAGMETPWRASQRHI